MKRFIQNFFLVSVSLLFSIFLAEFIVMLVAPQNLSGSWRIRTEKGLMVNKSEGSARHQLGERVVHYRFTEPHLRAPAPEGSNKVLVLGDSFTFGWLLEDQQTYVNLLQEKIDTEFGAGIFALHNAAAGGWGIGDVVAFAEDFDEEINPDIILVFLNTDDIGRALQRPHWKFNHATDELTRVIVPKTKLMELKAFVNNLPGYQWLLEHSHLLQLARAATLALGEKPAQPRASVETGPRSEKPGESERAKALGAALFNRLYSWAAEHEIPLLVSTTGWHIPPYSTELSEPTRAFMSSSDSLFEALNIPFHDPSDEILKERSKDQSNLMIPNDGHPNEAGAALIAERTFPFIQTELSRYCRLTGRCSLQ